MQEESANTSPESASLLSVCEEDPAWLENASSFIQHHCGRLIVLPQYLAHSICTALQAGEALHGRIVAIRKREMQTHSG